MLSQTVVFAVVVVAAVRSLPVSLVTPPSTNAYVTNANCTDNFGHCESVTINFNGGTLEIERDNSHRLPVITNRAACFFNGLTYFFGGSTPQATNQVDFIDNESGDSQRLAAVLPANVKNARAAVRTGDAKVVIAGGVLSDGSVTDAAYSFTGQGFTTIDRLPVPRAHHTLTDTPVGLILIGGGSVDDDQGSNQVYLLKSTSGTWALQKTLAPVNLTKHAAVLTDSETLLVCGGYQSGGKSSACYYYNPSADTWTAGTVQRMAAPRAGHAIVRVQGVYYIMGDDSGVAFVEKYQLGVSSKPLTNVHYANSYFGIAPLPAST